MIVAIGGIVHESSTFATEVSGPVLERAFQVDEGEELASEFAGTDTCIGGYLAACDGQDIEVVPTLHARAEPAGVMEPGAYRALEQRLLARLPPGPDLVLLDLHGAGVVAPDRSLDGLVLRAIRAVLPPTTRVAITMDLHANLPADVVEQADVLVGYKKYPHTDVAAQARLSARIALAAVAGSVGPRMRQLRLPMVLPPSTTDLGPAMELAELTREAERRTGVLACTAFHGFPYADTPQAGVSVVTVTDDDLGLCDAVNRRIGAWLWENRSRFLTRQPEPEAAVRAALAVADRPVVVADAADNPGGGATGDGTYLLKAVLASGAPACFATVHDPSAVDLAIAAGVGSEVALSLGGRHGQVSGRPVDVRATVRAITDGKVVQRSMRRGKVADFGPSVRLRVGSADVIVSSNRLQVLDPEILILHGIVPERADLIAVKSAYHFRSGFAHLTRHMISADAGGLTTCRVESVPRSGPSARLWPMSQAATPPFEVARSDPQLR